MKGTKKITINDLRADKGGNPDIYRRALSPAHDSSSSSSPTVPSAWALPDGGQPSSTSSSSSPSSSIIDEALSFDALRRSSLAALEPLRAKLSHLQKTVIAPKKKAGEDVSAEVARLKEWKAEIAKLSKETRDAERRRDECLAEINGKLANVVDSEGRTSERVGGGGSADGDGKRGATPAAPPPTAAAKVPPTAAVPSSPQSTASTATISSSSTSASSSLASSSPSLPLLSQERIKSVPPERILNLNVGVLGHVDTGKTSLVKTLSSVLSTAALDKSKQSRARGITLDLGFSAFLLPLPEHLAGPPQDAGGGSGGDASGVAAGKARSSDDGKGGGGEAGDGSERIGGGGGEAEGGGDDGPDIRGKYDLLQVTLVDCPGHASLIRTIIGGAQIIDMVLLVVDATKGMQTQTAECLVIAEMTTRNLIVVLNKVDMFPEDERETRVEDAKRKMRAALRGTKFEDACMVGISACVGGEKAAGGGGGDGGTHNVHGLLDALRSRIRAPHRDTRASPDRFHFAVDHCFPIKGQGTVLTGTCLSGSARPNDVVEFPTLATQKKVKGLQMFRRRANLVRQGDRAGICVSNFDAKLMERGIVASPGTVKLIRGAIAVVRKVRFFEGALRSGAKFHVSVGHTTVMATVSFWGAREIARRTKEEGAEGDGKGEGRTAFGKSSLGGSADLAGLPRLRFDWNQDFLHQDDYLEVLPSEDDDGAAAWEGKKAAPGTGRRRRDAAAALPPLHWARLEFLTPVYCPMDSLVIGSRLDSEVNANACRLAFSGRLVERYDARTDHGRLRSYTNKERTGAVCRLGDPYKRADDGQIVRYEVFGTDLFKKETNMTQFVGLLIETERGDVGSIQSSFGTSGKFRVNFPGGTDVREGDRLYLRFKRYANDPKKAIHQDGKVLPPARSGSRVDPPPKKKNKNKGKNGGNGKNGGAAGASESKGVNGGQANNAKKSKDAAASGEIVKLKGDASPDGKLSVAIVSGLFSMEDDIRQHKTRRVTCTHGGQQLEGAVEGSFGKMGKCKVLFEEGLPADAVGSRVEMPERET